MEVEELAGWARAWSHTGAPPTAEPALPCSGLDDATKRQVPHVAALAPQDALESHHGRPVRLRMLVVETLDPELYVGAAQDVAGTWRCGKYGNTLALEPGHKHVFWERRPVRAIPVPGLSEWASESDGSGTALPTSEEPATPGTTSHSTPVADGEVSIARDGVIVLLHDAAMHDVKLHDVIDVVGILDPLRHCDDADDESDFDEFEETLQQENVDDNGEAAPAKEREGNGALRVHAMIVHRAPNMAGSPYDGMLLKRSLSGDLHASMRAATVEWLAAPLGGDILAAELLLLQLITRSAGVSNGAILGRMTLNLSGLPGLHQSAPTQAEQPAAPDASTPLSTAAANASYGRAAVALGPPMPGQVAGATTQAAAAVAEAVAAIYPVVQLLPVTAKAAACCELLPEHHAASNRLRPGLLQQAPHGCLLLDETLEPALVVSTGGHDARLARHLRALDAFVRDGVVECAYAYQQVRLPASGSVAALSEAASRFADACHVSLRVQPEAGRALGSGGDARSAPLQGMRSFLATAWQGWGEMAYEGGAAGGGTPQWVSERLVKEAKGLVKGLRVENAAEVDTAAAFDIAATLLRSLSLSHGECTVGKAAWERLRALSARVRARNHGREALGSECSSDAASCETGDARMDALRTDDINGFAASLLHAVHAPDTVQRGPEELVAEAADDEGGDAADVGGGSRGQAMLDALRQQGQL